MLSLTPWVHEKSVAEFIGHRRDLSRWQARVSAATWLHSVTSPSEARAVAEQNDVGINPNTQHVGGGIDVDGQKIETLSNDGGRRFQLT